MWKGGYLSTVVADTARVKPAWYTCCLQSASCYGWDRDVQTGMPYLLEGLAAGQTTLNMELKALINFALWNNLTKGAGAL